MCGLVQCESGRIVGYVSLIDLIGVVIGGILIEECFRRGIDIGLVEDFFRTQTKGKEKKYSYTGIFVGIMIAGIGLMSVL